VTVFILSLSFLRTAVGQSVNRVPTLPHKKYAGKGSCVCVCVYDRLREGLREHRAPDLDASLIPIKMRAV